VSNGYEVAEGIVEDYDEGVESDDFGEAFPFGFRRRSVRPSAHRYSAPSTQAQGQYVRRSELQLALKPISDDMRKNATAIAGVTSQVTGVSRNVQGIQSNLQLLTLLPLLAAPKPIETTSDTTIGGTAVPAGTKLQVAGDGLMSLLPLLLLGGLGGTSGGSGSAGGMGDPMMLLVLAIALSDRK
jgi:hypothetical protein